MVNFFYELRLFKEIFFPRRCCVCSTVIETGCFCDACRPEFCLQTEVFYGGNRSSYIRASGEARPLEWDDVIERRIILYKYEGCLKEILRRVKFEYERELLPLLAEECRMALRRRWRRLLKDADAVICIPTSSDRRKRRGFDVPPEIFSFIGDLSCRKNIGGEQLRRIRQTDPLYALNAEQRQYELSGCFVVSEQAELQGKRVVLCDDIVTTGKTAIEAAGALLGAGAESVVFLSFSAAQSNW